MNIVVPQRMTVDEFLAWSVRQETGRFELQDGRVIVQQSQNVGHLRVKGRIFTVLLAAIERAGLPFYVMPDGATVRIDERTAYEPDALVAPLPEPGDASLEIPNPVIVVEVLSPSSVTRDLADKVVGYAKVASIRHYLVLDPEAKAIIWHSRDGTGAFGAPIAVREYGLRLDPLGIEVKIEDVFGAAARSEGQA
jgi:Uma2 family endonuclease